MAIDLKSRVSTKFEEDEKKVKNKELETDDATHLLQQEKLTQSGAYEEQPEVGRSLLSPRNSIQKEMKQKESQPKKVLSPFSKEFEEIATQREEKYLEEMEKDTSISSNRIQFYMIFAFVLYIIALCIGYHYTTFDEDVPQVVSMQQIDADEYLGKIDGYIITVQQLHEEAISDIEDYTHDIKGASELLSNLEKNNKKILEMQEEIKDIIPPEQFEAFQSQLVELYSIQANVNSAGINYAKNKNENTFKVLEGINEKYEDNANSFLDDYNTKFLK